MPLYKTITVDPHTKVLIWKLQESEETLRDGVQLTENCEARLQQMSSPIHRQGFLSVRQLLKKAGYTPADLYYNSNGRPHLKDGMHISITHSFEFAGIIVSNAPVGIDIEKQREKIGRIAGKFSGYELDFTALDDVRRLTVIWCVKESLYKQFATNGLSFKDHISVIPFSLEANTAKAWIRYYSRNEKFQVQFLEFEGFTAAWSQADN